MFSICYSALSIQLSNICNKSIHFTEWTKFLSSLEGTQGDYLLAYKIQGFFSSISSCTLILWIFSSVESPDWHSSPPVERILLLCFEKTNVLPSVAQTPCTQQSKDRVWQARVCYEFISSPKSVYLQDHQFNKKKSPKSWLSLLAF